MGVPLVRRRGLDDREGTFVKKRSARADGGKKEAEGSSGASARCEDPRGSGGMAAWVLFCSVQPSPGIPALRKR